MPVSGSRLHSGESLIRLLVKLMREDLGPKEPRGESQHFLRAYSIPDLHAYIKLQFIFLKS